MFDFDTTKLLLIGVVALAVIPPKDLPRVIRQVGQAVGKVRRMAAEFQGQVMEALKEAELDDLKKEITSITDSAKAEVTAITDAAKAQVDIDPAGEAQREITKAIEADPVRDMGGGAAEVYARATTAPAADAPALPPVNEQALASLAMPDVPAPPAVTHELIAAQAGLAPAAGEAPRAVRTVDLRKPEEAPAVTPIAAAPAPVVEDLAIARRKVRVRSAGEANGHDAARAAPELAGAEAAADAETGERVPYRKRFGYVAPARAARAARREG
jgi:sec-independent protein translocase protein TatB